MAAKPIKSLELRYTTGYTSYTTVTKIGLKLASEKAPKWGIGRKEKSASRASGDFRLLPLPDLGACSRRARLKFKGSRFKVHLFHTIYIKLT